MKIRNTQDNPPFKISKRLPLRTYIGYGLGHVLNDVCAAMWFSYLLVFLHLVLEFSGAQAGILLLVGQVADAIATPFVGYHSDKDHKWWIYKFGKRKIWYFMGSVCVIITFPFIFAPTVGCESCSTAVKMVYYSVFIIIFQFGWAAVQIAHMALIPEITSKEYQRTKLAAIRNGATVVASVLVYLVTWSILHMSGGSENQAGPSDSERFQHIVWSVMAFGLICTVLFYILIKEPTVHKTDHDNIKTTDITKSSFKELFLNYNLYLVGIVYMSSRLFINLTQVFISLYLSETLEMVASALALIPLVMYISSFVASFPVGYITKKTGRKITYILGAALGMAGCIWIQFGKGHDYIDYCIFAVAALLGAAATIVLVSSLDITTDLIGKKTNSGAFIYGIMSFADKLSNGVAVAVIQGLHNDFNGRDFYRNIMTYVCGGALLLGSVTVLIVKHDKKVESRNRNQSEQTLRESISSIS